MALPGDLTTFSLHFGGYFDAEGVVTVGAATGKLFPVDPATGEPIRLTHIATGQVILPASVGVHLSGETGMATVGPLPHTDNPGLSTVGFAYRVEWDIASRKPSPGNKTFAVPAAKGATADFDLLVAAEAVPGVLVPLAEGYSAYVIAVQNGYVGTEVEWLASLRGDPGVAVVDNSDGTFSLSGSSVTDNGDGTFQIAA